jgi:hypothetical protein
VLAFADHFAENKCKKLEKRINNVIKKFVKFKELNIIKNK